LRDDADAIAIVGNAASDVKLPIDTLRVAVRRSSAALFAASIS